MMLKKLICVVVALFPFVCMAQTKASTIVKTISLSGGNSFSGSGDIDGIFIKAGFQKKLKRWNYNLFFNTTIHDHIKPVFFQTSSGQTIDASMRHSVSGIELTPMIGFSLISIEKHDLSFGLGATVRYQSNGDNDSYSLLYPAATGLPMPVFSFQNREKLRTFAVGPIGQLSYDFDISKNFLIGAMTSFQFDTNGDSFWNYGLKLGCRLN